MHASSSVLEYDVYTEYVESDDEVESIYPKNELKISFLRHRFKSSTYSIHDPKRRTSTRLSRDMIASDLKTVNKNHTTGGLRSDTSTNPTHVVEFNSSGKNINESEPQSVDTSDKLLIEALGETS